MSKIINTKTAIVGEVLNRVSGLRPEIFIFWTTTIFYFSLWFINPGNKIIAGSFFLLFFIFYLRLKDLRISMLLTYLVSIVIFTGKTYYIQLIPAGIFPIDLYPNGYVVPFIISPKHILAFLMFFILLRDFIVYKLKLIRFNKADVILVCFYFWVIISDIIASRKPEISLLFSLIFTESLILYFYLRVYGKRYPKLFKSIFWIFVSIIIFQSAISFQQFINSAPIFKNIEHQVDIAYFGWAPDELQFGFRPLGTFPHANILGTWLSFLLSLMFVGLFKKSNYFLLITYIFGLIALVTTLSRSSWIGYLVSIMFILYVSEKVKRIRFPKIITKHFISLFILGTLLFIFFILPRVEKSRYSFSEDQGGGYLRLAQTKDTISLILQNPFWGVGSAMSVQEGLKVNPRGIFSLAPTTVHNWYLLVAAEHGLPALILFSIFMVLSIRSLTAKIIVSRMVSIKEYLTLGSLGGILALLVAGFFQNYFVFGLILLSLGLFVHENAKGRTQ